MKTFIALFVFFSIDIFAQYYILDYIKLLRIKGELIELQTQFNNYYQAMGNDPNMTSEEFYEMTIVIDTYLLTSSYYATILALAYVREFHYSDSDMESLNIYTSVTIDHLLKSFDRSKKQLDLNRSWLTNPALLKNIDGAIEIIDKTIFELKKSKG